MRAAYGVLIGVLIIMTIASGVQGVNANTQHRTSVYDISLTYHPHAPIHINGNSEFNSTNGVVGGNGTKDDPYIIEGWSINASQANYGISIQNTDVYFVIRNCFILNASTDGIHLDNVKNGTLYNNTINTINVSTARGIALFGSAHNTIANNTITVGKNGGSIYLSYSDNNTIDNNTVTGGWYGIQIKDSSFNIISNNTVSNAVFYGIEVNMWMRETNHNTIKDNLIFNNAEGIYLENTQYNTIIGNKLYNNSILIFGDKIYWDTQDIDTTNTVNDKPVYYYKDQDGGNVPTDAGEVILARCKHFNLTQLNISNAGEAVVMGYSYYINISHSNFTNSGVGIYEVESKYVNISYNSIKNNEIGVYLGSFELATYNAIFNNRFGENNYSIELSYERHVHIHNNTFFNDRTTGIYLYAAKYNDIEYNSMFKSGIFIEDDGYVSEWTSNNIKETNVVDGKPVRFYKDTGNITISNDSGEIIIANGYNISISNLSVYNGSIGILIGHSSYIYIDNVSIGGNNYCGAMSYDVDKMYFRESNLSKNTHGLIIVGTIYSSIVDNKFYKNTGYALAIDREFRTFGLPRTSKENYIVHNSFISNNQYLKTREKGVNGKSQAVDDGASNHWYMEDTQEGNYWSNWNGSDWGTPDAYKVDGEAEAYDKYPLHSEGVLYPPSAPTIVKVTAGLDVVTLTWDPPMVDGGSKVTGYNIYWGNESGNYTHRLEVGKVTTYTVTNLKSNVKYYFAVSANNSVGEGPKSAEVAAVPKPYWPHAPIHIVGDDNFTSENGVVSGNGTKENPYIIEKWGIDAHQGKFGIWIEDTDKYFIIRDCTIWNVSTSDNFPYGSGIVLDNAIYGRATNNTITGSFEYGIYLKDTYHSYIDNNTVSGNRNISEGISTDDASFNSIFNNTVYNNKFGIFLYKSSTDNILEYNTVYGNKEMGIAIYTNSHENLIAYNIAHNNSDGVYIQESQYNTVKNNTLYYNYNSGVCLDSAENNTVEYNDIINNTLGMLIGAKNNSITSNNIFYSKDHGIWMDFSSYNKITNNNFSYTGGPGSNWGHTAIWIEDFSYYNIVKGNTFYKNYGYGVQISDYSQHNTILYNYFIDNNLGTKGVVDKPQACDDSGSNIWYSNYTFKGNYWSNWDGKGWGTPNAYPLDGTAAAYDKYPIHGSNIPEIESTPLTIAALFLLIVVIKFNRSMGNK